MRSDVRVVIVDAGGLGPYVAGLRALEREILYPIDDGRDHFRIDHGPAYTPFFTALGEPYFAVVLAGEEVAGSACGILRQARLGERTLVTGYACDYKLAVRHRGVGLGRAMLTRGLLELLTPRNTHYRAWRFGYGAAMRGAKGDVLRSGRGLHPLRLLAPWAELAVYFVSPEKLAQLPTGAPPPPTELGLNLSPTAEERGGPLGLISTAGRKDLRLVSTGEPWPLVHLALGPSRWAPDLGLYLSRAGAELLLDAGRAPPPTACFAIDRSLEAHVAWLARQGIEPGATCRILAWRLFPTLARPAWVHLATSEI